MIIKWIIFGILLTAFAPTFSQISLREAIRVDSLLEALDTTTSNYRLTQIAEDLLSILDTTKVDTQLYRIYQSKGLSHRKSGDYRQALLNHQAANRIAHALRDSFRMAQSLYNMGIIKYNQGLSGPAHEHFEEASEIFSSLDSLKWVAYIQNAYGLLERQQANWEQALVYYQRSYKMLDSLGFSQLASVPLNNIGDVFLHQDRYEQSLYTFQESLQLAKQQGKTNDVSVAHLNIGQSWRGIGRYDIALREIRIGLHLARAHRYKRIEALGLRDLSETFERIEQLDSALFYLQHYIELKDSLQREENTARLEELYVAYETQKARNEAAEQRRALILLRQEQRLDYLTSYFIISLLFLALIISSFFFVRNRMKRKLAESELRNQKLVSEQIRQELDGKQKDLTNLALEIARKNELFTKTNEALTEITVSDLPPPQTKKIRQLIQYNSNQLRINEDLEELLLNIEQVNADFFEKLKETAPDLTPSEKQLCALLRLSLTTKDIASIRNISPRSVEMARYRLRKKLPIEASDDIYAFMQNI